MKVVVASTHAQAELAMRELGLGRREWRLAHGAQDLRGVRASDLIEVVPWLEGSFTETEKRHEVNLEIGRIEKRDGVTVQVVRT